MQSTPESSRLERKKERKQLIDSCKKVNFKDLRGSRTQGHVCRAAGINQAELSNLERYGATAVSLPTLRKILSFYFGSLPQ